MEFLQEINDIGYPTEYLLARIHGRRLSLLGDWDRVLSGPDIEENPASSNLREFMTAGAPAGIWESHQKEPAWIYHQMNSRLRNVFQPYFMHLELNTLLTCLRYKTGKGNSTEIERLLYFSLLSKAIKDVLKTDTDVPSVINILGKKVSFIRDHCAGLELVFLKDGFMGAEQEITNALFKYILNADTHPLIKRFFVSIADARNIITLHKHLRWDTTSSPFFIEGGNIRKSILSKILQSYNAEALATLVYKHTGLHIEGTDAARVENALQRRLTGRIKKWEREFADIGLILNYLWRCAMEAKNLSIIYHGREIDRGILKEELVY
ncbi:MAG: V-type ATPase subunit [Nitrospirae bacterium]|nr:V-type ATPase subunit [Nitrospirota bacterium]